MCKLSANEIMLIELFVNKINMIDVVKSSSCEKKRFSV